MGWTRDHSDVVQTPGPAGTSRDDLAAAEAPMRALLARLGIPLTSWHPVQGIDDAAARALTARMLAAIEALLASLEPTNRKPETGLLWVKPAWSKHDPVRVFRRSPSPYQGSPDRWEEVPGPKKGSAPYPACSYSSREAWIAAGREYDTTQAMEVLSACTTGRTLGERYRLQIELAEQIGL